MFLKQNEESGYDSTGIIEVSVFSHCQLTFHAVWWMITIINMLIYYINYFKVQNLQTQQLQDSLRGKHLN